MSDRLSPILVKELRQGIRSQLFTGSFLLVQALLFLFGLSFVLSDSLQKDSTADSLLFWTTLAVPLLILVPASASQAIEREVSGRTLDLLLLTRLSSYRIVLGKWASVVAQASLLLVSALPYVILRYFLGGIDVVGELKTLGGLLLASGLLAGIAMGFWSLNLPRLAKWAAVLFLIWVAPVLLLMAFSPHGAFATPFGLAPLAWIYGALFMLVMIESAAARIGPPSENHWTRVRAR
jgi:ABC-type transport system involved in multi-copper enzyme maturation permease subunit